MILASIILVCLTVNFCLPIPDDDYWDNDDFVPFQSNRHDEFDWMLTKALLLSDPSNMILSPVSVKLLLSLLSEAAGQDTSTHRELAAVLPSIQSVIQARELHGKIFKSLSEENSHYKVKVGAKVYIDRSITPRQRYAAIAESYYSAKVEQIEFSNGNDAAKIINDWCVNITDNHIKELIESDDVKDSVMIMLNALYFNVYWRRPFPISDTVQLPFYVSPTSQARTSFMALTNIFYYMESQPLDAKLLRLPYKGRKFAMTIILPNAKDGLNEVIRKLEGSTLHRAQWLMSEEEVHVRIPKFEFDYTSKLNDVLQDIGIRSIFTNESSLPALARYTDIIGRLKVSKMLQKAVINFNEHGSTFNVSKKGVIVNPFGGDTAREFIVNRPFVFVIEDETTGALLFAGKVTDPSHRALAAQQAIAQSIMQISSGSEKFSLELYKQLALTLDETSKRQDFIISPFSVWSLLILIAEGAMGNTYAQLRDVMGLEKDLTRDFRRGYSHIQDSLKVNTSTIELVVEQVIFTDINRPVEIEYEDNLIRVYAADIVPVDFHRSTEAYNEINNYVNEKTHGKINEIIQPEDLRDLQMIVASAIFFKGKWKFPFDKQDTRKEPFFDENGNNLGTVNMMSQKGVFGYADHSELQAHVLELPYGNEERLSMYLMLPRKGVGLSDVIGNIAKVGIEKIMEDLKAAQAKYEDDEVEVFLPRIRITSDFVLNTVLEDVGLTDIFDPNKANLTGIAAYGPYLSRIIHKVKVEITEGGTVAGTVSGGAFPHKSSPQRFYANRPFAFVIVEKRSKLLLFSGQVTNPTKDKF